jgi:hypothetical protein
MAKNTNKKIKELKGNKPERITEDELKAIQGVVSPINQAQMEIGRMETRKHLMMHQVGELQGQLKTQQDSLEEKYGKVNINITTGQIDYDGETDS